MHDLARTMWPGAYRVEVDADRAARRARVRTQLHALRGHVNAGGDSDEDAYTVDTTDHRHGAGRHL